jgi:hypothetical protein
MLRDQADSGYEHFKVPICNFRTLSASAQCSKTALLCHIVFHILLLKHQCMQNISYVAHNAVAVLELHIIVIRRCIVVAIG